MKNIVIEDCRNNNRYRFQYQELLYLIQIHFSIQIVAIRDIIPPPQREAFNDVYIAYELMDTDLHQIIRSNQALSEEHCQVHLLFYLWNTSYCQLFHMTCEV
jgi:hypothetical protein